MNAARLDRFAECGSFATVEHSPATGRVRIRCNTCKDRLCEACGRSRGRRLQDGIVRALGGTRAVLVTLTLRANETPLIDQIKRLRRCFASLIRSPLWKASVQGGVAVMEIKVGTSQRWHVHLHVVCVSDWIDQRELSGRWHAITGDSYVVDVRRMPSVSAGRYVAKYVSKPADRTVLEDDERLDEFAMSIRGSRMFQTFGSWRKFKLDADPTDDEAIDDWMTVGRLEVLVAKRGENSWIDALLNQLNVTGESDP